MARTRSSGRKKAVNNRKASTRVRKATQRTTTTGTTTTTSTTQPSVVNNTQDANVEVNGAGNGGGGNQPVEAQAQHQQPQSPGESSLGVSQSSIGLGIGTNSIVGNCTINSTVSGIAAAAVSSVPVFISGIRNHGIGSIGSMDNHVCVTNQYASQIASGNYPTAVVTNNANAINGVAQLNSVNNSVHDTMNTAYSGINWGGLAVSTSIGCHTSFNTSVSNVNTVSLSTGVYTVSAGNLGINLGGLQSRPTMSTGFPGGLPGSSHGNMGSIHTMTGGYSNSVPLAGQSTYPLGTSVIRPSSLGGG